MPRSVRWPGAALGAVLAMALAVGHVATDSMRSDTDRIADLRQSRRLLTQLGGSTETAELVRLLDRRINQAGAALAFDAATRRDASIVAVAAAVTLVLLAVLAWSGRQGRQVVRVRRGDPRCRELEGAVESQARELFELSTYLQTLQEAEKADLARNLHDELGALLTAAKLDLAWVQKRLQNTGAALQTKLAEIGKILESAMSAKACGRRCWMSSGWPPR
jgi:signal transduction histidine kinase